MISPQPATGCVLRFRTSRQSSTLAYAPASMPAMRILSSTIWASRTWYALPHTLTLFFWPHTDPVVRLALYAQVTSLNTNFSSLFAQQRFENFTIDGALAGLYKNAGTFSYLRVIGAGHEVPAYLWRGVPRGAAALQMFTQIMSGNQLSGT